MYAWYSSEYPKFLAKKFTYIVYNMYMYHRIANKRISKKILKSYSLHSKKKSSYPLEKVHVHACKNQLVSNIDNK